MVNVVTSRHLWLKGATYNEQCSYTILNNKFHNWDDDDDALSNNSGNEVSMFVVSKVSCIHILICSKPVQNFCMTTYTHIQIYTYVHTEQCAIRLKAN